MCFDHCRQAAFRRPSPWSRTCLSESPSWGVSPPRRGGAAGAAPAAEPVVTGDLPISVGPPSGELNNYFSAAGWNGTDFVALWMDNSAGCWDTYCEWDLRSLLCHGGLGGSVAICGKLLQGGEANRS